MNNKLLLFLISIIFLASCKQTENDHSSFEDRILNYKATKTFEIKYISEPIVQMYTIKPNEIYRYFITAEIPFMIYFKLAEPLNGPQEYLHISKISKSSKAALRNYGGIGYFSIPNNEIADIAITHDFSIPKKITMVIEPAK